MEDDKFYKTRKFSLIFIKLEKLVWRNLLRGILQGPALGASAGNQPKTRGKSAQIMARNPPTVCGNTSAVVSC